MIEAVGFAVELTEAQLVHMYRLLLAGRLVGERLAAERASTVVNADPIIGAEAPQVAIGMTLEPDDVLVSGPLGLVGRCAATFA